MSFETTPAPLAKLREQIDLCRGIGKRAVFPDELKLQTVALLDEYSPGAILQALRISPTSLSRWKNQALTFDSNVAHNNQALISSDKNTFMSLPAVDPCPSNKYPLTVVLGCTDSDEKATLNGEVSLQQWQEVVASVTKLLLP